MPIKKIFMGAKPRNFKRVINFVEQNFAKIEHRFERNIFFTSQFSREILLFALPCVSYL